jgi:chromosome segregation ATPase
MQNANDVNQAIQALQREMQKVVADMRQKENLLKETASKANLYSQEIKNDDAQVHQKQQEILRLQQDMDVKKREIAETDKVANRIKQEIERLKLEQIQKNNAVGNLNREQKDALNRVNIRH